MGQLESLEKGLKENTLSLDAKKTKKSPSKKIFFLAGFPRG